MAPMVRKVFLLAGIAAVILSLLPQPAYAQAVAPGFLDTIVNTFLAQAQGWQTTLQQIARGIFASLLIIEVSWVLGRALINGIDFGPLLGLVMQQAVAAGFFYWLLINPIYLYDVVHGFWLAGAQAGGSAVVTPSDVVTAALAVGKAVWSSLTWGSFFGAPALVILLAFVGIIVIAIFGWMAATLVETLIEAAICSYAGIIMLGFGSNSYTRDFAIGMYRYALSVGVKLMVLQLIMGVATTMITQFAAQVAGVGAGNLTWQDAALMLVFPVIFFRLVERVPGLAQGMVMGAHIQYFGGLITAATALAAAGTSAAASIASAGSAVIAAGRLASAQSAAAAAAGGGSGGGSGGGGGGANAISQAAMITGRAASNMASSAAAGATAGRFMGRMANNMNRQAGQIRANLQGGNTSNQSGQGSGGNGGGNSP